MRRMGKQLPRKSAPAPKKEIERTSAFKLPSEKVARIFALVFRDSNAQYIKSSARVKVKGLEELRLRAAILCHKWRGHQCGGASI